MIHNPYAIIEGILQEMNFVNAESEVLSLPFNLVILSNSF